jgi:indolepyruvate ferredoxin oxidoreductase
VGVVWPLESHTTREFATGLREILVVEEKRQVIEYQLKEELYNWRDDVRPTIVGKFDEADGDTSGGEWSTANPTQRTLLRANADLTPALIALAIAKRLKKLGLDADTIARIDAHLAVLDAKEKSLQTLTLGAAAERTPWFCSGCPHNTSTKVPEGSRAMAGIGCHFMSLWMDRSTTGFTQMGGEGVPWSGQQPFCTDQHIFANIGDGTYFHSGILAVRQSVASGVNITYKILYNDAVAMTGGQPVGERAEGHSVVQIAMSMKAEGAQRIVVVTDEPEKYEGVALVEGVRVFHRDELDRIQREMREIKGTTVIIYDQTCATEKRRRRKRGTMVDPAVRVMINEEVCEGCGDCGVQSNCLSVEPLETELGRKRTINQSTCNKDTSCLKGFCPSFVTVEGGTFKKKSSTTNTTINPASLGALPEPVLPTITEPWGTVVAGVGGTGVITIGQLLGMAAHMEGKGIVTQDSAGLAQKGGATWSHILIANMQNEIRTTRVSMAAADLIIGCDPIVSASKETTLRMRPGRTHVAMNSNSTPTAAFVKNGNWQNPAEQCVAEITAQVGVEGVGAFDADALAKQLMGDTIYVNPMILGYAWQKGWVPLHRESLVRAIELNDVQVKNNLAAFEWGRHAAQHLDALMQHIRPAQIITFKKRDSLEDIVANRMARLTDYQNAAYAQVYQNIVERVRATEAPLGKTILAETVARHLYKLMAYKDEYEVARLHTQTGFLERIKDNFEGDFKVNYHLAPPLWSKRNAKGELVKRKFGPIMLTGFKVLAKFKGVRGTALDVFGKTEERVTERALIREYMQQIDRVLEKLSDSTHAHALEVARVPETIKGFGHVKERNIRAARALWASLNAH